MHICYVLAFSFPNGSAATRRVVGICNMLSACGHEVTIVSSRLDAIDCSSVGLSASVDIVFSGGRAGTSRGRASTNDVVGGFVGKLFFGRRLINGIRNLRNAPDIVIAYGGYTPLLLRLLLERRRRGYCLIFDAVEWASLRKDWIFSPYLISVQFAMKVLLPRLDGVICVSQFLKSHYQKYLPTIYLPPIFSDFQEVERLQPPSKKRKFIYMGNSDYDNVDILVTSFIDLVRLGQNIELHVAGSFLGVGVFDDAYIKKLKKDNIFFHGSLSQNEVQSLLEGCDALIFLRDNSPVTRAGFPTKFVQALCAGVPVITSAASDIADYVLGKNAGLILPNVRTESVIEGIKLFAEKSDTEILQMKRAALNVGKLNFDPVNFVSEVTSFLRVYDEA